MGINSSKVYCKWQCHLHIFHFPDVLIVAKCIVNGNKGTNERTVCSINSSKVYCKSPKNPRTGLQGYRY